MRKRALKDPLVTKNTFADELGISATTFWRRRQDGLVPPPVRIGRRIGWPRSVVDACKLEMGWPEEAAEAGSAP